MNGFPERYKPQLFRITNLRPCHAKEIFLIRLLQSVPPCPNEPGNSHRATDPLEPQNNSPGATNPLKPQNNQR
jgi:hypothetical protein